MGDNINTISWNVRGLNCPNKRGDVKWVLYNFRYDITILQETKMEEVNPVSYTHLTLPTNREV